MTDAVESPSADGHLHHLSRGQWDELAQSVGEFVEALHRGERPIIADHLPFGEPSLRRAGLVEMVHEELESRLKAGESVRAGEYLDRFPELAVDPDAARELIRVGERLRQCPRPSRRRPEGVAWDDSRSWRRWDGEVLGWYSAVGIASWAGSWP